MSPPIEEHGSDDAHQDSTKLTVEEFSAALQRLLGSPPLLVALQVNMPILHQMYGPRIALAAQEEQEIVALTAVSGNPAVTDLCGELSAVLTRVAATHGLVLSATPSTIIARALRDAVARGDIS